jgi:hypothetical protein
MADDTLIQCLHPGCTEIVKAASKTGVCTTHMHQRGCRCTLCARRRDPHDAAPSDGKRLWTVVRFPDGSWSYGGSPDNPDYAECYVTQTEADSGPKARDRVRRRWSDIKAKARREAEAKPR